VEVRDLRFGRATARHRAPPRRLGSLLHGSVREV
jgi:hypothetical protein